VADDFEYICDSNYFNEKLNHLFSFKDENVFAKKANSPIQISDDHVEIDMEELSEGEEESSSSELSETTVEVTESVENDTDSEISLTDEESECHSESVESSDSMETPMDLWLVIKEIPAQVVAMEKCENTLDHYWRRMIFGWKNWKAQCSRSS
jgi:hypothetical protein